MKYIILCILAGCFANDTSADEQAVAWDVCRTVECDGAHPCPSGCSPCFAGRCNVYVDPVTPEPETIEPQLNNCRLGCIDNDCQNVGGSPLCGTCQGGRCGGHEPIAPDELEQAPTSCILTSCRPGSATMGDSYCQERCNGSCFYPDGWYDTCFWYAHINPLFTVCISLGGIDLGIDWCQRHCNSWGLPSGSISCTPGLPN